VTFRFLVQWRRQRPMTGCRGQETWLMASGG
jgi:hypothetical protein